MTDKVAEIKALPICRSKQAVEMVRQLGMSKAEAARQVGVTTASVGIYAKQNGIAPGITPAGRCVNSLRAKKKLHTRAAHERRLAATTTELAEYRRAFGIPEPQEIIEARASGMTFSDIARMFGVTRNQVAGVIRRYRCGGYRHA